MHEPFRGPRWDGPTGTGDLAGAVREAADTVLPIAEPKGPQVQVTTPDRPLRLGTEPHEVRHVVGNLLSSAAKFTSSGKIRLSVKATKRGRASTWRTPGRGSLRRT